MPPMENYKKWIKILKNKQNSFNIKKSARKIAYC